MPRLCYAAAAKRQCPHLEHFEERRAHAARDANNVAVAGAHVLADAQHRSGAQVRRCASAAGPEVCKENELTCGLASCAKIAKP